MIVVRSEIHHRHHSLELDGATIVPSWEAPDRAEHVDRALDEQGTHETIGPDAFDAGLVDEVHDPDYVRFLTDAWARWQAEGHEAAGAMAFGWPARRFRDVRPATLEAQLGYYSFAADCSISAGTWVAARDSAAIADTAAQRVLDGAPVVFARCRPPGHHAMKDQFGGYCYLNNAAIAAQRLRSGGHEDVALLDVDYHHGNGTQDIFYERDDVRFCSIHGDPSEEFPYFLGHADEHGTGRGTGHNRNLPLPRGTAAETWFDTLEQAIGWLNDSSPTALVVSLGLDTFVDDPISHFRLQQPDFIRLGQRLAAIDLPTVLVMEGGYATEQLGQNVASVLSGFETGRSA
ncbi:MAG: histone deacetylase family protein [Actinobacteria bacterium]|nr:histone deacetylase family protein [Actinomycetota bacterium]